ETAHRGVAVDADDQPVAERARLDEVFDVAAVEQVEDAVREHDALARGAPRVDPAPGLVRQRFAHPAPFSSASSSSGTVQAAVPTSRITTPAAWLASRQASGKVAPAASASATTLTTVSP